VTRSPTPQTVYVLHQPSISGFLHARAQRSDENHLSNWTNSAFISGWVLGPTKGFSKSIGSGFRPRMATLSSRGVGGDSPSVDVTTLSDGRGHVRLEAVRSGGVPMRVVVPFREEAS
jgi:hypothetical protein